MAPSFPGPGTPEDWTRNWLRLISTASSAASSIATPAGRVLPTDSLAAVLNAVRDRVVGRSRTFRLWDRDVTLTLDDVSITGSDLARSLGQFGTIHLVARDIHWDSSRIDRLEFRARNVHVRPGLPPTLVAAPVSWELWAAPSIVSGWLADAAPTHGLEFVEGTPLVRLSKAPSWFRLEVRPVAEGRSIRLECIALRIRSRRVPIRLPDHSVPVPVLPDQAVLSSVETFADKIIMRGLIHEWQRSVSQSDLQNLLAMLRTREGRIEL